MTEPQEPSNAELLAFMREQAAALQALTEMTQAGFALAMTEQAKTNAKIDEVRDELRGEIRATEANLVSRINAVEEVVRSVKADVASHVGDGGAHHRHAA